MPDKAKVPEPVLVKAPDPLIIPGIVSVVDVSTSNVPDPVRVTPRLALNEILPFVFKVPPLKIILPASNEPGVAPRLFAAVTDTVPAAIVVDPVYVLVPDRAKVPAPVLVIFTRSVVPQLDPIESPKLVKIDSVLVLSTSNIKASWV